MDDDRSLELSARDRAIIELLVHCDDPRSGLPSDLYRIDICLADLLKQAINVLLELDDISRERGLPPFLSDYEYDRLDQFSATL